MNGLSGWILHKLSATVPATEAGFAVMGMSVSDDLSRLALGAVHRVRCNV